MALALRGGVVTQQRKMSGAGIPGMGAHGCNVDTAMAATVVESGCGIHRGVTHAGIAVGQVLRVHVDLVEM